MKILTSGVSLNRFFSEAARAERRLLMLDYDGTMAPFQTDRDKAFPYPGVRERLGKLYAASKTRLVIVSGRAVRDLMPLLGLEPCPEIWGSHGAERYVPGEGIRRTELRASARKGLNDIENWIARQNLADMAEKKPASIAIHYRAVNRAEQKRIRDKIESAWAAKVEKLGLGLHEFDGGIELRAAGISKADAVEKALAENPDAAAAYLGDDMTDEDAFRALAGRGLRVLVRPEPRETAADLYLIPPDELLEFLDRWLAMEPAEE